MQYLLTLKQRRVLQALRDYQADNHQPPTLEELRQELGVDSLRTVTQYLDILERKGYLVRRKGLHRNIELRNVDGAWGTVSIPVIASVGCDDLSLFAQEQRDEFVEVDKGIVEDAGGEGSIVAVRAIGDSMNDAGINTGDYVLIRFTEEAQNGDRVAAIVNDMVTVKRIERVPARAGEAGYTILHPESKNPKFKPIILRENFKIAGKVLCVIPAPSFPDIVPAME